MRPTEYIAKLISSHFAGGIFSRTLLLYLGVTSAVSLLSMGLGIGLLIAGIPLPPPMPRLLGPVVAVAVSALGLALFLFGALPAFADLREGPVQISGRLLRKWATGVHSVDPDQHLVLCLPEGKEIRFLLKGPGMSSIQVGQNVTVVAGRRSHVAISVSHTEGGREAEPPSP